MSPAQQSPERPRQCSGNELATSNSTANRFLGTAQRSWMTNDTASSPAPGVPRKPPVQGSKPRVVTHLPSRTPTIPPLPGFTTATQSNPKVNGGPSPNHVKRRVTDPVQNSPPDRQWIWCKEQVPVSPITPGVKVPNSTADRGTGAVNALPSQKTDPAKTGLPHQLPVLPSPEPSNDSHPSPAVVPEANHQSTVAAPAVSTLANPQPVTGEGIAPTVPAVTQPNPGTALHRQSPSKTVSPLPSNSPVTFAPSPKPNSIWKHAMNRLKILQEKSAEQRNLSETVELPRLRILEDACRVQDMFYLALHQVYCIISFAPSQLASLRPFGIQPDLGMNVIKQLLVDNQRLSGDFLKWCASYPSPLLSMLELEEYKTALSQVANCLSNISKHWLLFEQDLRARAYPPQVEELVDRLGVISPTLQSIIFTALSRRLFGSRDQLLKACSSLFERDKATYKKRQTFDKEQRQKEAVAYSWQYKQLCVSHGVFPPSNNANNANIANNTQNKNNITMPVPPPNPPPNPPQLPTSTTAPQPSPNLPQAPIYQQGQHPQFPPYHQPPMAHYASPNLPRPDSGTFMSTPPNLVVQQGQQFPYPQPSQLSPPLSNTAQTIPQHQANSPQVPPVATSRPDVRQGPTFVITPNNYVPDQRRGPQPKSGPAGQARVGRPAQYPNSHPGVQAHPGPTFAMPYSSPYPTTQSMPSPAAYGPPTMLHSHTMPQLGMTQMTQMTIPPQLGSGPPAQQPRQASSAPFSPHLQPPKAVPSSSPTMLQSNNRPFQPGTDARPTPSLVHYFSDFAVPATKLTSNRSAFKFSFKVSPEALERRPRLAPQAGSHMLAPYFSDGDVSYRLRCIRCEGQSRIDSLPVWSRAENAWPDVVYIHINNKEVHRPRNSKSMPIDINRFLEPGTNEIRLNVLHNAQQRTKNVTYAVAVEVLWFNNATSFKQLVKKLPSGESLQQIQNRLGANNDDDDLMIMDNFISIDLRDPFTTRIFDTPIRGVSCTHRECFDLSTFLQTITFTPPLIGKRSPYLRCPICRKDIRPHLLIVDEFLLEIRAALAQQQKSETAKCIRVKSDGSWEAVLETDDDNKNPTKKLKRDRASFESDMLKTEPSPENNLSRIPETTEVIEID